MKRFYKTVDVVSEPDALAIHLDGRPVRTPAKHALTLPTRALADAVAGEWRDQPDQIDTASMPLTRLANTAIDRVVLHRNSVIAEIAGYGETDLVCYRTDDAGELRRRQDAGWGPLVDWLKGDHDIALSVTTGLLPLPQSEGALRNLKQHIETYNEFVLSGLHMVTAACGSVAIGLAVAEGRLDGVAAWELSLIDETWQIEQWGEDEEATKRRETLRTDIGAAATFLTLCRET